MFKIIDREGNEQDTEWLHTYFGEVEHHKAHGSDGCYRVTEVVEFTQNKYTKVTVLDSEGNPKKGIGVTCRRIDGSDVMRQHTDVSGQTIFETTQSYPVPGQGPYLVAITASQNDNDAVIGLGNVMRAHRHLNVVYQFVQNDTNPNDHEELRQYIFERTDHTRDSILGIIDTMSDIKAWIDEIDEVLGR